MGCHPKLSPRAWQVLTPQHRPAAVGALVDHFDDGDGNANDASNEIHETDVVVVEAANHQRHQLPQPHAYLTN